MQSPHRFSYLSFVVVLAASFWTNPILASPACVRFDVSDIVACRDVTPPEFAALHPGEKLVEARFTVSSLVRFGSEQTLLQYLYQVSSPEMSLYVIDYAPKTALATDVAGTIGIEKRTEKSVNAGVSANGKYNDTLAGNASANAAAKSSRSVRFEQLPPLELLAASGTTGRGTGAYFKLKPSSQTSLEGAKQFSLILRVPIDWRGDYVSVHCSAYSKRRNMVLNNEQEPICGAASFVVTLYLEADEQARATAARMIRAERNLREVASANRRHIKNKSLPTFAHRVGAAFSITDRKIPKRWLDTVLSSRARHTELRFVKHLPKQVRQAVAEYSLARTQVHQLRFGSQLDATENETLTHDVSTTTPDKSMRHQTLKPKWQPRADRGNLSDQTSAKASTTRLPIASVPMLVPPAAMSAVR